MIINRRISSLKKHYAAILGLLAVAIITNPSSASGATIDEAQALKTAQEFLASKKKAANVLHIVKPQSAAPLLSRSQAAQQEKAYHILSSDGDGTDASFVIVSANDRLAPIVGYSLNCSFDPDSIPAALADYLQAYSIAAAKVASGEPQPQSTLGGVAVEPFVKVRWNQNHPYNLLTPRIDGKATPTGCVPTAVAQVMKYYKYPQKGQGTVTRNSEQITLVHEYNWVNMLDEYTEDAGFTDAQANEVSVLMRDLGYAMNSRYDVSETGTSPGYIPLAMVRNFNYSTDIQLLYRETFTSQGWIDLIRKNLIKKQPVLYGASSSRGGHQFLCDGIDSNDMLHINWGWGGVSDGYFDVNFLSPHELGTGAGSGAFYSDQTIVTGIHPGDPDADMSETSAVPTFTYIALANAVDTDGKLIETDKSRSNSLHICCNIYNPTDEGIKSNTYAIGFLLRDKSGKPLSFEGLSSMPSLTRNNIKQMSWYIPVFNGDTQLIPDGEYTAQLVMMPYEDAQAPAEDKLIPAAIGDLSKIEFAVHNGAAYISDTSYATNIAAPRTQLVSAGVETTIHAVPYTRFNLNVRLRNMSAQTTNMSYYAYFIPESQPVEDFTPTTENSNGTLGALLYGDVEKDFVINMCIIENPVPGRYRVLLAHYAGGELVIAPSTEEHFITIEAVSSQYPTMLSPLTTNFREYNREHTQGVKISFDYYNPGTTLFGSLELKIKRPGADNADAISLATFENAVLYSGSETYKSDIVSTGVFWDLDLGEYECFVNFIDQSGKTVTIEGANNQASITLAESLADYQIQLASAMIFNGGKEIPFDKEISFDVKFDIMSPTGLTLDTNSIAGLDFSFDAEGKEHCNNIYTHNREYGKVSLAPGESTTYHATIYTIDADRSLIGRRIYVRMNRLSIIESYSILMQHAPFRDFTSFVISESSAIENIDNDDNITISNNHGTLSIQGASHGDIIEVYSTSGILVHKSIVDSSTISVDNMQPGIYIVKITRQNKPSKVIKTVIK